ncbi:MAG TPA: DUF1292 domain-containing protein [Clostridiaceae bacterium]|nr:DUF1292 domain-containing protein [Clostridiaceae bacterium]
MYDERDDVVVLVDENGQEIEFQHIDTIEMNGNEYVVLVPAEEVEADEEEVIILKVEQDEKGEDILVSVEDEEELDEVFEEFKMRMDNEYDFFDDDEYEEEEKEDEEEEE